MQKKRGKAEEEDMFYSHCLFSRKGPLGAIWIAAHCYRKLRKVQVNETDISSSVDKIVLAEVPLALRVLGHLLIGVVRIYAKKVEYLYHDCNEALIRIRDSFSSGKISLSKEAQHTPYFSITLPKRFELDAFDLDDVEDFEASPVRPKKGITLEDIWVDEANQYSVTNKMQYHSEETGSHPNFQSPTLTLVEDVFSPHTMDISLQIGDLHTSIFDNSIEKFRGGPVLPENGIDLEMFHDDMESCELNQQLDKSGLCLEQIILQESTLLDLGKNQILTEDHLLDGRSPDESNLPNSSVAFTPEVMVIPTPTNKERPRLSRSRKRKNLLDEEIILSNQVLRQGIQNASDLVRSRGKGPNTTIDAWKAEKISNLHHDIMDPLIPYISSELKALLSKDYLNHPEPIESEVGPAQLVEIEQEAPSTPLNHTELHSSYINTLESVRSSDSPTANKSNKMVFVSTENRDEELSVTGTRGFCLNLMGDDIISHDEDFLKQDRWSIRTREVAQYLHSSFLSEGMILSLKCHLDGRTRKTCARFFYETLVLKTLGCIDVKQDSPYHEILLLATPQLKAILEE